MRIIKRYPNRKLYDTAEKRYLTLKHLAAIVEESEEEVRVIENATGKDITSVILSKALAGKEKETKGGFLPKELLSNLIQGRPQVVLDSLRSTWETSLEQLKDLENDVEGMLKNLIDKGKLTSGEAMKLRTSLLEGFRDRWAALEAGVSSRLEAALDAMPVASRRDVERIEEQLESLSERLEALALDEAPAKKARKPRAKKATAKKKTAKKAAKKASTKKASTKAKPKKAAAKKAPAKKKVAKKAPTKTRAKKAAAKKAPAKRAPAKKRSAKKATSKKRTAK